MCVRSSIRSFFHLLFSCFCLFLSSCCRVTIQLSLPFSPEKKSKHKEVPVYSRCNHDNVPGYSKLPKLHLSSSVTVSRVGNFNI